MPHDAPHTGDRDVVSILADLPTATIYESAGKWGDVAPYIRPVVEGARLAGRAFTVKARPASRAPSTTGRMYGATSPHLPALS